MSIHELLNHFPSTEVRPYIAEPDRGQLKWAGKRVEQAVVYANRQRVGSHRGKHLLRRRGERAERTFAHAYETGALRRLYVRGKENVQKKLLLQATACNLALLLRKMIGAGTASTARPGGTFIVNFVAAYPDHAPAFRTDTIISTVIPRRMLGSKADLLAANPVNGKPVLDTGC